MFIHNKDLQFEVRVSAPDPRFATLLQEQFGGANGEHKAAMQYFTQVFLLRGKNPRCTHALMIGAQKAQCIHRLPFVR